LHWVGTQDGGLDAERELLLSEQTSAEVIFLSTADTDLSAVASEWGPVFGARLRLTHAGHLRQPVAADHFVQKVVSGSRILVARLLGGRAYFPHLLQALEFLKENATRPRLLLLSATQEDDPDFLSLTDFDAETVVAFYNLFAEGGSDNMRSAAAFLKTCLTIEPQQHVRAPVVVNIPQWGWYKSAPTTAQGPHVWVTFYRALHQTSDLAVVDAIAASLELYGLQVSCFFCHSLKDEGAQQALMARSTERPPDVVLTMQSFAVGTASGSASDFPDTLGCPVLQIPVSVAPRSVWLKNTAGLAPGEATIQVALPEIDGRILATVAGFKEDTRHIPEAEFTIKKLVPCAAQIQFIAQLASNWSRLRTIQNSEKRIAIILANYPNRDGRIGNGVGLDTPASAVNILRALAQDGYEIPEVPPSGNALMASLLSGMTNDSEGNYGKIAEQFIPREEITEAMSNWPIQRLEEMERHWPDPLPESIHVPGIRIGNVFVGIQPPRGFSMQTQAAYHSPDLPPPPQYVAFYHWIRHHFRAHAIIHLGKHGNLEWLPGRSLALGGDDYPQLCLGPIPHFYPFIVNNPGEGTQAKRRSSAVIIDHLTPPLTRAGLYGELEDLERLLEEHAHCVTLYPRRAAELESDMEQLLSTAPWRNDLPEKGTSLPALANFLCELKESQIRSALHIFGQPPEREQATDFILSLVRMRTHDRASIYDALSGETVDITQLNTSRRDALDSRAREWIHAVCSGTPPLEESADQTKIRVFIQKHLVPLLAKTSDEITNLLGGLNGRFVPPGPAGAPTRGRVDVLPTGRNFYALDPRVVPTHAAWRCGKALGESLLRRHFQDHGAPLRKLAMVIWGTSNMRTGGDDLAQALWLWGCEPVWDESTGRVTDFKILPASMLGRPRVDITIRVSGLFRDAFGDTLRLLAAVPKRLAFLDEPLELNPVRESFLKDQMNFAQSGHSQEIATRTACLRVFTSGPGCYGTGVLQVIDAGNWETRSDLATVFLRWGEHAAGADGQLTPEPDALRTRLREVEAIAQNQDNREHDILDSDDYFQFQGGLQAAVEMLSNAKPANYHGDSSDPAAPKIRSLEEELIKVIHSRALNPRWIAAMNQHGYKGAFEIAATVDYLFGYGATTGLVLDHHFEAASRTLVIEQESFFRQNNPDALKEASERLLEAAQRGLWAAPNEKTIGQLETILLSLIGDKE
jgi:cobaltochelatase CobN